MSILESFVAVWTALIDYLTGLFPKMFALFYTDEKGLTFIGVMAVVMAGISLLLLVWNLIRSFFTMRG